MGQSPDPSWKTFIKAEEKQIVTAMRTAIVLNLAECLELLDQAAEAAKARRASAESARPNEVASIEAVEHAIAFLRKCYEGMKHRVERNPGRASKCYEDAKAKLATLSRRNLPASIMELIEAQEAILPIQLALSEAVECLFRAHFEEARTKISLAEEEVIEALKDIAIDVEKPTHILLEMFDKPVQQFVRLPNLSQAKIVGTLGVCADFMLSSSVIKLQNCFFSGNYHREIRQFRKMKKVFDIFEAYTNWTSETLSDKVVLRLHQMMTICASFAEASTALVEAGYAAENEEFDTARRFAQMATEYLERTSSAVFDARIKHQRIFREAVINIRMFAIPPMIDRWEKQELHSIETSDRLAQIKSLNAQLEQERNLKFELLKELLREVERTGTVDPGKIERTRERIEKVQTTEEKNLVQKFKEAKSAVEEVGAIVASVSDTVPRIGKIFSTIAKTFGIGV